MIPKVSRGDRMGGLLSYLQGPGRHNEHTEPHLVAGDDAIMAWHGVDELDRATALQIARELDEPRRHFDVEVARGHVWHCSLSLHAGEGLKSDETWAAIAEDFVEEMGFTASSGKSPCRWVAVRHGASTAGNDHVHIAVSLVREDGTKASTHNDYKRAQDVARQLETKHGLAPLESRQHGYGRRATTHAERAQQERAGAEETVRETLERRVRGYAAASSSEAEFVRRCRDGNLLVRPRFQAGRDDVVAGYSVALRPQRPPQRSQGSSAGDAGSAADSTARSAPRPVWFGGGRLGRDLTLPRLRAAWRQDNVTGQQGDSTPAAAGAADEAVAEWRAAHRGQPIVNRGGEQRRIDPELWERCHRDLGETYERMRNLAVDDVAGFAHLAHDTAGVLSAWSVQTETRPGPLAHAARDLSRYSQVRAHQVPTRRVPQPGMRDAALLVLSAVDGHRGAGSYAILLRQLQNMLKSLHDHHAAAGRLQAARHVEATARHDLQQVAARLPSVPAGTGQSEDERAHAAAARAGQGPQPRPAGPPVRPGRLNPFSHNAGGLEEPNIRPGTTPGATPGSAPGVGPGRRR